MKKSAYIGFIIAFVVIILAIVLVVSLQRAEAPTPQNVDATPSPTVLSGFKAYTNQEYGFSIQYPEALEATTTFASSYLVGSGWNLYSDSSKNTGTPIISFRKIGSNEVTNAELRIGVSTSQKDVDSCLSVDSSNDSVKAEQVTINGIAFTSFTESGAATMHYSKATSYRTVHNNTCFAIDEFVAGTNPEVYDPPKTAPFEQDVAFKDMNKALNTFTFTK